MAIVNTNKDAFFAGAVGTGSMLTMEKAACFVSHFTIVDDGNPEYARYAGQKLFGSSIVLFILDGLKAGERTAGERPAGERPTMHFVVSNDVIKDVSDGVGFDEEKSTGMRSRLYSGEKDGFYTLRDGDKKIVATRENDLIAALVITRDEEGESHFAVFLSAPAETAE